MSENISPERKINSQENKEKNLDLENEYIVVEESSGGHRPQEVEANEDIAVEHDAIVTDSTPPVEMLNASKEAGAVEQIAELDNAIETELFEHAAGTHYKQLLAKVIKRAQMSIDEPQE